MLYSEGKFPADRVRQIAPSANALDRIFVEEIPDQSALARLLQRRVGSFCAQVHVSLVVIDSVAGLFRFEDAPSRVLFLFPSVGSRIARIERAFLVSWIQQRDIRRKSSEDAT